MGSVTKLDCLRCGHRWHPNKPWVPRQCPRCKSAAWAEMRGEEKTSDPDTPTTGELVVQIATGIADLTERTSEANASLARLVELLEEQRGER